MWALVGGKVIKHSAMESGWAVVIKDGLIDIVIRESELLSNIDTIDVEGAYIAPGFLDLQLNGCGGVLFNDDISEATINTMHQANLRSGTTGFLPTLITASFEDIKKALAVTLPAHVKNPDSILGIHIEGPFINVGKKGIHNQQYIRSISEAEVELLCEYAQQMPVMLTLAPEKNDPSAIKRLVAGGVKVSLGHSMATYEEAKQAFHNGAAHVTHLFNAMTPIDHKKPGLPIAALNSPSVYTGIIADGAHVHFDFIGFVHKIKSEKLYLVTDAAPAAGSPGMKTFQFGGNTLHVVDGKAITEQGVLGGSIITMIESIANLVNHVGLGLPEAVSMASLYPATYMGVHHKLGRVEAGYAANLAIFDANFKMLYTCCGGNLISL